MPAAPTDPSLPATPAADQTMIWLGVDTGGTFTDFVLLQEGRLRLHKVLSTPDAPERAILQGIRELGLTDAVSQGRLRLVHGSTVATNAALEGKTARTAFITNRGFADVLTIGRQARRDLYDLQPAPVPPPVPETLCIEVDGRMTADGDELEPLDNAALQALQRQLQAQDVEAIAVSLLFSFRNDSHERQLRELLETVAPLSLSSEVWPVMGEYERGMATWLNASLGPRVRGYLERLMAGVSPCPVAMMQSSGLAIDARQAASRAVQLLLSGPAGGLAAAQHVASRHGWRPLLTFDMGGTSTDVALLDGSPAITSQGRIGHWPVPVPMVDMHTIGAGGGSLARVDEGGLLQVGPQSAGAFPGPACYGRGGTLPTVTDANAVLGLLRPEFPLGGSLPLDVAAARAAVMPLAHAMNTTPETAALGILRLANEHMARALRMISVERGHSLQDIPLFCFGGAGGLHVCDLAETLGISRVVIPAHGGVFSAAGMLLASRGRWEQQGVDRLLDDLPAAWIDALARRLLQRGLSSLADEGIAAPAVAHDITLELRYKGQHHTLPVAWTGCPASAGEAFAAAHEARYGHRLQARVELAMMRVRLQAPAAVDALPAMVDKGTGEAFAQGRVHGITDNVSLWWRDDLPLDTPIEGPLMVGEAISATWVKPGWCVTRDQQGQLHLQLRVPAPCRSLP
jgi:N-methylhydantoinase A